MAQYIALPSFCKQCGESLADTFVPEEDRNRLVCVGCGHIHYINPAVVAGTIPIDRGRVWLLRRAIEPRLGAWTFPAGYMEMGESVEEAAVRETLEELNMAVRIERLLGVYSRSSMATVHIVYIATALSGASAGSEALEVAVFRPNDIPWHDLAFWSTQQALREWVESSQ